MMSISRTIQTHAKINLILKVAPPNEQGFHPIRSWMHPIDLSDQLTVTRTDSTSTFTVKWDNGDPVEWPIESDLLYKAHRAMESHLNRQLPVDVQLIKSIPAGGGLGGGSSNAAGMMLLLNELFEAGLDEKELQSIAHSIGTDIPFFLDLERHTLNRPPRPAIVSGIGELIHRLDPIEADLTLLIPPFGCPTGAVYQAFDRMLPESGVQQIDPTINAEQVDAIASKSTIQRSELSNDLTAPATEVVPQLRSMLDALADLGLTAHLSGSGSTIFMLGHPEEAVVNILAQQLPDLEIITTRLVQ